MKHQNGERGPIYVDRASFMHAMFDLIAECDNAEAVGRRLNTWTRTHIPKRENAARQSILVVDDA